MITSLFLSIFSILWLKSKQKNERKSEKVSRREQKPHRAEGQSDLKKKKRSSLQQLHFDVWTSLRVPLDSLWLSAPPAADLTFLRHLSRLLTQTPETSVVHCCTDRLSGEIVPEL